MKISFANPSSENLSLNKLLNTVFEKAKTHVLNDFQLFARKFCNFSEVRMQQGFSTNDLIVVKFPHGASLLPMQRHLFPVFPIVLDVNSLKFFKVFAKKRGNNRIQTLNSRMLALTVWQV